MCGIVGFWGNFSESELSRAVEAQRHRGPDEVGLYMSRRHPVGIGMRRLSIIDPKGGRQPFSDEQGDVHVIFNGEIYNHRTLRDSLRDLGARFATSSDTEVILQAYRHFGVDFVGELEGMFSICILDERRGRMVLARDHLGIKPLYYWQHGDAFVFASELKALACFSRIAFEPDVTELCSLLTWGYGISERTIAAGVKRLMPGTVAVREDRGLVTSSYWTMENLRPDPSDPRSLDECAEELRTRLTQSVKSHLIADVPVGIALSGGIDSSSVAGAVRLARESNVKAQVVSYGLANDETPHARGVARHLDLDLDVAPVNLRGVSDRLEEFVWWLEEPIPHIQMPTTYEIGKAFKSRDMKVALLGEGSDELFGGYARHLLSLPPLERIARGSHADFRTLLKRLLRIPKRTGEQYRWEHGLALAPPQRVIHPSHSDAVREFESLQDAHMRRYFPRRHASLTEILRREIEHQLPNSQLLRVDKLTMASSVEARVPFLDRRLVEWAMSVPDDFRVTPQGGKVVLRRAMAGVLPRDTLRRPKYGLGGTQSLSGRWMQEGLSDRIMDLTSETTVRKRELFDVSSVMQLRNEFADGGRHSKTLFCLALSEVWSRVFTD